MCKHQQQVLLTISLLLVACPASTLFAIAIISVTYCAAPAAVLLMLLLLKSRSAFANLIACAPGDNTYDGVQTSVSLVSSTSPYHSIYTTTSTNGETKHSLKYRYGYHSFLSFAVPTYQQKIEILATVTPLLLG